MDCEEQDAESMLTSADVLITYVLQRLASIIGDPAYEDADEARISMSIHLLHRDLDEGADANSLSLCASVIEKTRQHQPTSLNRFHGMTETEVFLLIDNETEEFLEDTSLNWARIVHIFCLIGEAVCYCSMTPGCSAVPDILSRAQEWISSAELLGYSIDSYISLSGGWRDVLNQKNLTIPGSMVPLLPISNPVRMAEQRGDAQTSKPEEEAVVLQPKVSAGALPSKRAAGKPRKAQPDGNTQSKKRQKLDKPYESQRSVNTATPASSIQLPLAPAYTIPLLPKPPSITSELEPPPTSVPLSEAPPIRISQFPLPPSLFRYSSATNTSTDFRSNQPSTSAQSEPPAAETTTDRCQNCLHQPAKNRGKKNYGICPFCNIFWCLVGECTLESHTYGNIKLHVRQLHCCKITEYPKINYRKLLSLTECVCGRVKDRHGNNWKECQCGYYYCTQDGCGYEAKFLNSLIRHFKDCHKSLDRKLLPKY